MEEPGRVIRALLFVLLLASIASAASAASPPQGSPCTEKLRTAPFLGVSAGDGVIESAGIRSVLVCRYYGATGAPKPLKPGEAAPKEVHHGRGRFARSRELREAGIVKPLARAFSMLHRYTEKELKTMRCPFSGTGAGYAIVFRYIDGTRSSLKVFSSGCPYVTDGSGVYAVTLPLERRLDELVPLPGSG
jgi:hypothetical protein